MTIPIKKTVKPQSRLIRIPVFTFILFITWALSIILSGQSFAHESKVVAREYNNADDLIIREDPDRLLWQLPDKEQVWLTKKPRRVVVLLTSLLNLWYETGGQAIARCSGDLHVPPKAMDLPCVGTFNNPNLEKIMALEPDLVISSNLPAFRAILPILEENQDQLQPGTYCLPGPGHHSAQHNGQCQRLPGTAGKRFS